MSADPDSGAGPVQAQAGDGGMPHVDARQAVGVQIGQDNTQIIYNYSRLTWADGAALPPLVSFSGTVDSPYRGLRAFEEQDAPFFFGREAATADVLKRMSRCVDGTGLLVVSGVSGAGKSSLLRAGVLPQIRGAGLAAAPEAARWPCLLLTPGPAPLDVLAVQVAHLAGVDAAAVRRGLDDDPARFALTARQAALAQPGVPPGEPGSSPPGAPCEQQLLLVADQFEQLFTQCPDEGQRQAFITALHAAAGAGQGADHAPAAIVVLGVRADFEARCANYPQLADAVQDRYLVTAMTERQLRMAITGPAKRAGSQADDDLVEVLLTEVRTRQPGASGAGALPLLSHALDQAWRSRTGEALTLADYERTGGIEGAVAGSAQRAYDHLAPAQQIAARQVFIRLTATSSDGVDTVNRALRAELTEGKGPAETRDVEAVLEAFTSERLLTLAADHVEISHEILLTAWPLLRDTWLAETHADRLVRTRLHNVAAEWARHSRDASYLYSGSLLQAADETAARIRADPARHPPLTQTERDFLQASKRRRTRRRSLGIGAVAVVVAASLAAAGIFYSLQQTAVHRQNVAISRLLTDESEILGDTDPIISKLESVAAWRISPSDDARYAMLSAAARPGIRVEVLPAPGLPRFGLGSLTSLAEVLNTVAFSPDAKIMAIGSFDGTVRLWDVATRQQIGGRLTGLTGSSKSVNSVAFSPDGTIVAAGSEDGRVWLWDVATRQQIGTPLAGDTSSVDSVAFSPDGKIVAAGSDDHTARLWDVATRQQIGTPLAGDGSPVMSVTFSKDGKTLATGSKDGRVWLWDVATRQQIGTPLAGDTSSVDSVAFSLHGKLLATGSEDGTVRLWNVATHREVGTPLASNIGIVKSMAFSPDGRTLATGSGDHTARLWDVINRQQIGTPLIGYTGPVTSVRFSPDGKTLATGSGDGTVRLWDVASVAGIATLVDPTGSVLSVAFSPDGKTLATGGYDHTARLWDVATRQQIGDPLIGGTGRVNSVAFSPDGKTLAAGSDDHTVRLWDVASRTVIATLTGHTDPVLSVAFSPDGKTLASGSGDGTVRLWNVATHRQIGSPLIGLVIGPGISPLGDLVESVAFSPDGKTLATVDFFGSVRLWDVATHRQIGAPLTSGVGWADTLAFSPDGKTLATGGVDDTVRLLDVASRTVKATLTGHTAPVLSVAFSPDGKTLASGGKDDTVRLWDVATRQQIGAPLTDYGRWVTSVAFSPDGMTLAGGSNDYTVRFWDTAYLTNPVAVLCASAGRSFTRAEWARYAPGPAYQSICP